MMQRKNRRRLRLIVFMLAVLLLSAATQINAQISKSYQAEDAEFFKAKTESEHVGYTGTGYVNFDNESGSYVEFAVFMAVDDTQTVHIRYANGVSDARTMQVWIDSAVVAVQPQFRATGAWTSWRLDSIRVFLIRGENRVRFISMTSNGGPNIDKIDVSGTPGIVQHNLTLDVIGEGYVESTPPGTLFDEAAIVELTAIPDSGWQFQEWLGDASGSGNPLSVTMNSAQQITAVFIMEFATIYQFEDFPTGFAAVDALGQNGCYGGEGGDTTTVTTGEQLFQILDTRRDAHFNKNFPPRVLLAEGVLIWDSKEMMDVKETYDLTILGKGDDARIEGFGLNIYRSHNIIVCNIEFNDCPDDCINVTDSLSHHVWIDHCTFSDSPDSDPNGSRHDGTLDIKHGASFVTVSWNHFYNHQKTALLGHSDSNADEDVGRLKVTYHHNWWDNTGSRHPRVRFGEVHVFNNFYDNSQSKMGYGIASTMEADVLVEANYFRKVGHPTHSGYGDSEPGDIVEINNIYEDSGAPETRGTAFNPSDYYDYQPDDPNSMPSLLMTYCGSGKMGEIATAIREATPHSRPVSFELSQNFPNPFNPVTLIRYCIPENGWVTLKIYDLSGQEIARLVYEYQNAGEYAQLFDASGFASGIYVYRLEAGNYHASRKMILLK